MNEFHSKRIALANEMAAAGAKLLEHTCTAAALAAIPNTEPQQYVVAGTLAMIGKVLPADSATQAQAAAPATDLNLDKLEALARDAALGGSVSQRIASTSKLNRALDHETVLQLIGCVRRSIGTVESNLTDEHKSTLQELLICFASWQPAARVLGNVRADDAFNAIRAALAHPAAAVQPTTDERTKFEAWVRSLDVPADALERWQHGPYVQEQIEAYWSGWQARGSAPVQPVAIPAGWISLADRLPELHVTVALLDENRWMNTGSSDHNVNWHGAGYLCEFGQKYWSIFGEMRSQCLDAVTHWMPLPAAPDAAAPSPAAEQKAEQQAAEPKGDFRTLMHDYRYCREDHKGYARSLVETYIASGKAHAVNSALEKAARRVEADCIGFADDDAQLNKIIRDIRAMKVATSAASQKGGEDV